MSAPGVCFVKIGENWINLFEIARVYPNNAVGRSGSRIELKNGSAVYSNKNSEDLVRELWDEPHYTYLL